MRPIMCGLPFSHRLCVEQCLCSCWFDGELRARPANVFVMCEAATDQYGTSTDHTIPYVGATCHSDKNDITLYRMLLSLILGRAC